MLNQIQLLNSAILKQKSVSQITLETGIFRPWCSKIFNLMFRSLPTSF